MQSMQPLNKKDPRILGTFEILALLGTGGMGRAYLARSLPLENLAPEWEAVYRLADPDDEPADGPELVVVKVIRPDLLRDQDPQGEAEARARFATEVDAIRAVASPRVPSLIGADPDGDPPWLAMDFIHGPALDTLVHGRGPLAAGPCASLGLALVEALRAIHGAGLYHRDLKPGNIVLGPYGPVVLDFGLAVLAERRYSQALTESNKSMGTFPYMPLEQLKSTKKVDHAADVYALGASLFFALTGKPPFPFIPLAEPPLWTGVDTLFRPLLEKIIVPAPADRPSLDEVEDALLDLLVGQGLTAEAAAAELAETVAAAGLAPQLPAAALADHGDPEVRELAQRAVDRGAAPDDLWPDDESDLFDDLVFDGQVLADDSETEDEASGDGRSGGAVPAPRPDSPGPQGGADAATPADPDEEADVLRRVAVDHGMPGVDPQEPDVPADSADGGPGAPVTSYPLPPPARIPGPARSGHRVHRGALRVAARLRKEYTHSGSL
ncbi:serine/threonine-protein kinase [Streptomyces sp. NPDC002769]|uniref:serine/threonine-protein kinase n=1 Tax=Streptomyces sp. NPDC002769 TaxID=3154542 RepID=UPI00332C4FCA